MTTIVASFYSDDVFDRAGDFFDEGAHVASSPEAKRKRGGEWLIAKFSGRFLRTSAAILSVNLFTLTSAVVSASKLPVERPQLFFADAAASPPRLTAEQARNVRLMRAAFAKVALEEEEDLKGPDPDYGF